MEARGSRDTRTGPQTSNMGGCQEQKKGRKPIFPWSLQKEPALPTP